VEVKRVYTNLIDAENKHDVPAVKTMAWESPSTFFVAKAPVGWHGFWRIGDVMQNLHDMYRQPFRIDPIHEEEKVIFITPDVAETYAPLKIAVAYGGQNAVPLKGMSSLFRYRRGNVPSSARATPARVILDEGTINESQTICVFVWGCRRDGRQVFRTTVGCAKQPRTYETGMPERPQQ